MVSPPAAGAVYYGQDAQHSGNQPEYHDNGDKTVTDLVTGLMWQKSPDQNGDGVINYDDKLSFEEALAAVDTFSLAGHTDWRLPTIKEQYSLILFSGTDPSGYQGTSTAGLVPFIDTNYFGFGYGDLSADERLIDAQYATSTLYVGTTMMGDETMFGVNFSDGRIKGYGIDPLPGQTEDKQFYVTYVRGSVYGVNEFVDNGDGTVTDLSTGLMWMQHDNGEAISWENALAFAVDFEYAGYSDWRLPNAKELQSIVDYSRSPSTTNSAAIDPLFNCTQITDEGGNTNYPFYWTGTTHANYSDQPGNAAAYVCFGEALGWMESPPNSGNYTLMDVHGAGAQRSDFKSGDPGDYPFGHGPQGDVIRIDNYVRLVRNTEPTLGTINNKWNEEHKAVDIISVSPNPATGQISLKYKLNPIGETRLNICDLAGTLVRSVQVNDIKNGPQGIKINLSDLVPGLYICTLISDNGSDYIKIVVQ
jgi:hypothetical protein